MVWECVKDRQKSTHKGRYPQLFGSSYTVWSCIWEVLGGAPVLPVLLGGATQITGGRMLLCCEESSWSLREVIDQEKGQVCPLVTPTIIILTSFYLNKSVRWSEMAQPGSSALVLYHPPTLTPRMVPVANHSLGYVSSLLPYKFPPNLLTCDHSFVKYRQSTKFQKYAWKRGTENAVMKWDELAEQAQAWCFTSSKESLASAQNQPTHFPQIMTIPSF